MNEYTILFECRIDVLILTIYILFTYPDSGPFVSNTFILNNCQSSYPIKMTSNLPYFRMTPEFHGEEQSLPRFIEIFQKLLNKFYITRADDLQNEYLI